MTAAISRAEATSGRPETDPWRQRVDSGDWDAIAGRAG